MTEYFLPFTALEGTRATPYAVYGSRVYSFKIDNTSDRAIDGKRLRIIKGRVYAVFGTPAAAKEAEQYFPDCPRHANAFDLGVSGI